MSITKYTIKNAEVLSILEDFRYTYRDMYQPENTNTCLFTEMKGSAEHYTDEEEMRRIINMGQEHSGSPENSVCYPIKPDHYKGTHPQEYSKTWNMINSKLTEELGVQHSALSTLYPPQGFIGWHNNTNDSGYNLIFTWSQDGDGWFKYVDPKTQEVVTIKDDKGWNLKAGHFGEYGSGDVIYHAASTECYRMTLSYVLGHSEDNWKDCIDFITT